MCRFASDILSRMSVETNKLKDTLGPDTANLTLRIGVHSGPVTAGVLRGDRARFQLFGDTMNTASRMESTGVPGRIQVSQATATLLHKKGRSHWVQERPNGVEVKGKGTLVTYFLTHTSSKGTLTSSSNDVTNVDMNEEPRDETLECLGQRLKKRISSQPDQ